MTWLSRFRAPRCPTCHRKISGCRRAQWAARRVDVGRLRELSPVAAAVIEDGRAGVIGIAQENLPAGALLDIDPAHGTVRVKRGFHDAFITGGKPGDVVIYDRPDHPGLEDR